MVAIPRRSLTGAWIETLLGGGKSGNDGVAPLRGRGLKQPVQSEESCWIRRSLTGAWIETRTHIPPRLGTNVAPLRGRGLKRPDRVVLAEGVPTLPYGGVD